MKIPYTYDFILYTVTGLNDFYTHLKNAFDVLYEEGQDGGPLMRTVGSRPWKALGGSRP
ncbi:unnamed protein product [Fusarium graminearum]|nr:unnamed protein product [Fusarium graminearum]